MQNSFENEGYMKKITCPTIIIHGIKDTMVSYHDSLDLAKSSFNKCLCHVFLRLNMTHNQLHFLDDIYRPIHYVF